MKKLLLLLLLSFFLASFAAWAMSPVFLHQVIDGINWDILDEDCSDISDWSDNDTSVAVSEVDPAGYFRFDTNNGNATNAVAERERDIGSYPDQFTVQITMENDVIGTLANEDSAAMLCYQADEYFKATFASDGFYLKSGGNDAEVGVDLVKHGGNSEKQIWHFLIDFTGANGTGVCDVYLKDSTHDWSKVGTAAACSTAAVRTEGRTRIYQKGHTTDNMVSHVDSVKIATGLHIP